MLEISHCNYRRHILQTRKHKRYQMNLNSHYKKNLFMLWNLNIQQMFCFRTTLSQSQTADYA